MRILNSIPTAVKPIPVACADFTFPCLGHDVALDLIAGMGFEGADLSLIGGNSHLPVERVLREPRAVAREVLPKLESRALRCADVNFTPGGNFTTLALNHPDPCVRRQSADAFRAALEFTAEVAGCHITLLPGIPWPDEPERASFQRAAEELAWRVESGRQCGVVVSIEPHVGSIASTPHLTERLLDATPGLTLTLDYTHFVCQGFSDQDCEPLLPFASHLHVRGASKGRMQTPVAESTIDHGRLVSRLLQSNYRGWITAEYVYIEWQGCNRTDNVSETVLLLRELSAATEEILLHDQSRLLDEDQAR